MSLEVVLVGCALVIVINVIVVIVFVNDERVCVFGSSCAMCSVIRFIIDDILAIITIVIIVVIVFVNDDHVCGFGSGCALIGAF